MNTDTLHALIQSTVDLYARFDRPFNRDRQLPIFEEEVRELIEAARDGTNTAHVAEEAGDVFVTAIGLALAAGATPEQLMQQAQAVIDKNNAKTHATHHVNAHGKIARRKPETE
jgi:NTP pyrophosphatase (non-canonical NTP hydrolase)